MDTALSQLLTLSTECSGELIRNVLFEILKEKKCKFAKFLKDLWTWSVMKEENEQKDHDGPVSLHWLIRDIPSYQTLLYLGIGLKHKTPSKD